MKNLYLCMPIFSFVLLSCGGSNNNSALAPTAVNQAPSFTSAASVAVAENSSDTVYTAQANDPEGGAVTYALVSGADDNAVFDINLSSGELSFISAPDFENPTDTDTDNIYIVTLQASDAQGASETLMLNLTVTDRAQNVVVRRVGATLNQPLFLAGLPDDSGRVIVAERAGVIKLFNPDTQAIADSDFLDIRSTVNSSAGEQGLLGMAFAPDYAASGALYVNATNNTGDTEIRRYTAFPGRLDLIDPLSEDVILSIPQPLTNHNGGWLGFDANGFLVIPIGDGGGAGDPQNLSQNPQSLLGKVLRIDVNGDDFPEDGRKDYSIPEGNTFRSEADGLPEIFAIGLRNPFRASFDPRTGDLLMGDVGQGTVEEISRLPMTDSSLNFGWNVVEGTQSFNGGVAQTNFTPPVAEYLHGSGPLEGRSVTGGYVYRGPVEALQNVYIFSDFISSRFWGIAEERLVNGQTVPSSEFQILTEEFLPTEGAINSVASFGTDQLNNLYIVDFDGDVFRLEAAN